MYFLRFFSVSGPSPPLPVLPNKFQTKVEANIINKRITKIAEEFVDGYGNRVAVRLLRNNTMNHILFDYTNGQSIYVSGNIIRSHHSISCHYRPASKTGVLLAGR